VPLVIARMHVKPEHREDFLGIAREVTTRARSDKGCQDFRFFEDVERPNQFIFVERWESLDDVSAHYNEPYLREAFARGRPWLVERARGEIYEITRVDDI